ncbi:MAG: carboxypeptidase-like regulatory domain-containing protein [Bacteroidota bacterium]
MLLMLPSFCFAQAVYEGQVLNKNTELAIPNVNVILLKQKKSTQTNTQGYFRLITETPLPDDTLVFSSVGYQTYRLPVSAYQKQIFILLEPVNNQLTEVNINASKLKNLTIDKFSYSDIKDLRTEEKPIYSTYAFFTFGSYAKLFEAPANNVLLTKVELGRRDFDIPNKLTDYPRTTSNKFARFLVHVMTIDTITGKPNKKIFTKEITLTDNALKVTIDLKSDKITIPTTKFFIVIEWLKITINEVITLNSVEKVEKVRKNGSQLLQDESRYLIRYQPCIVGFPGNKPTIGWITLDNINWEPQTLYNSLALSATITY